MCLYYYSQDLISFTIWFDSVQCLFVVQRTQYHALIESPLPSQCSPLVVAYLSSRSSNPPNPPSKSRSCSLFTVPVTLASAGFASNLGFESESFCGSSEFCRPRIAASWASSSSCSCNRRVSSRHLMRLGYNLSPWRVCTELLQLVRGTSKVRRSTSRFSINRFRLM
jgi:hypothetical protein